MKQEQNVRDCYGKSAQKYAQKFFGELSYKPLDRLLLQQFAVTHLNKGLVLDLGCGNGQTTSFLYKNNLVDLLGIDLSEQMIEEAKKRSPRLRFEQGDMLSLPVESSTIAGIVAFYAIVHFELAELELALQEMHRVLMPGGQLLFSFHVGSQSVHIEEFLEEKVDIHFHFFEIESVLELLKKQGWIQKEVLQRYPYPEEFPSQRAYLLMEKNG